MEAVARLNNDKASARKMRLVIDLIRGKDVAEVMSMLKYTPKEAARRVEKLVQSAIYNWQLKNEDSNADDSLLYIKQAFVDSGKTLKRFRPAPMGRAYRIRKRTNHVTIVVDSRLSTEPIVQENSNNEQQA